MSKSATPGLDAHPLEDDESDINQSGSPAPDQLSATVPFEFAGQRLDQVAAELFPEFSRAKLQCAIREGLLTANGAEMKPKNRINGGETIVLTVIVAAQGEWLPENIPLDIVFEDNDLIVVNKPAGLVVHPAAGNYTGTLLNGLLHYRQEQANIPRAGIVHRLDKDTSGVMVVAKTPTAQTSLVAQLQARTVKREYEAIVLGDIQSAGSVDAPIGRHPTQRTKMAVVNHGKHAVTHYKPLGRYCGFTHLRLQLETGRTHQIRVHMAHRGFPLLGDPVYGRKLSVKVLRELPDAYPLESFSRQALHAMQLGLQHPSSHEEKLWQIPMADDIAALLRMLQEAGANE